MKKKLLTLASAVALFSNVSVVKAAEDMSYGISLTGGTTVISGTKFKKTATSTEQEGKKWEFNAGVGGFFGYDFTEMLGVETIIVFRFMNPTSTEAGALSDADKKSGKTAEKAALEIEAKSLSLELLFKIMLVEFDGGHMFIKVGPEFDYKLMKSVKVEGKEDKKHEEINKNFNMDGIFKIGASFLDEMVSMSVDGKYTLFNQANNEELKKIDGMKDATLSLGAGNVKVGVTLGFNFAPLIG